MDLHHANLKPDWDYVAGAQRNRWQRLGAQTHGIITPGNLASLTGLAGSLWGIWLVIDGRRVLVGVTVVLLARSVDMFDGLLARATGTKSPLGATLDAAVDKIAALAALISFTVHGLLPLFVALSIGAQNLLSVALSLIARQRFVTLLPGRNGKNATAGYWLSFGLFTVASLAEDTVWQRPAVALAYLAFTVSMACGIIALVGYTRTTFARGGEKFEAMTTFDRYVVIQNPASTDAHKITDRINELRELSPKSEIIITRTGDKKTGDRHLLSSYADKLGKRTLLCIAAGDGTVNSVADALLHDPSLPAVVRQTPILPLWCGNANDLAYMLNGNPGRQPIHKALRHGQVVAIQPLQCTMRLPDGSQQVYTAACYASFGASAFATRELEQTTRSKSPFRRFGFSRLGQEFIAVSWALARAPTFTVSEQGRTKKIFERTHLNGSRFAKVIGLPLRLTDGRFHRHTIERKLLPEVLLHIVGLASDRNLAKKTVTYDEFTVHDPVWAQFDGEAVHVPAGTRIEGAIGPQPFYALSTRLNRYKPVAPPIKIGNG